jgi:hypothetical protein
MKKIIRIIKELFACAIIGVIVGTFYHLVLLSKYIGVQSVIISTALSGLIGIVTGQIAKHIFIFFSTRYESNRKVAYIFEGIAVTICTVFFSLLMGTRGIQNLILMSIIASTLSGFFTYWHYRKYIETNEKLKEFQNNLKRKLGEKTGE